MLSVTYLYSVTEGLTIWLLNHFLNRLTRFLLKLANPLSINLLMFYFLHLHMVLLRLITYMSRHTFCSVVTLANNVSLENIAKMVGHTNTRMTMRYAKVLDQSILRDMQEVKESFAK